MTLSNRAIGIRECYGVLPQRYEMHDSLFDNRDCKKPSNATALAPCLTKHQGENLQEQLRQQHSIMASTHSDPNWLNVWSVPTVHKSQRPFTSTRCDIQLHRTARTLMQRYSHHCGRSRTDLAYCVCSCSQNDRLWGGISGSTV